MTSTAVRAPHAARSFPSGQVRHGTGFWIASIVFLVTMAFSTVPTPLWSLYQQRDQFSTFMITIAFAVYAAGVVASLLFVGHLGDTLGRRRVLTVALVFEIASAVIFISDQQLAAIIAARIVCGLGIGMLTATITAHILDLHLTDRPGTGPARGQITSGVANLGGFGVGALASGLLAQFAPNPLVTPHVVFLVLLVISLGAIRLVPETATRPAVRPPYRPQRVRVPQGTRGRFFAAGGIGFAAFALLGLFTSLAPVFVAGQLGIGSRAVAGFVAFVAFAAAAAAQLVARVLPLPAQIVGGGVLAVAGIGLLTADVSTLDSLAWFYVSGIACGLGAGLLFKTAVAVAGSLADAAHRGEVLAGIFLIGYVGLTVPVVGLGIATLSVSTAAALQGFAVVISAITLLTAAPLTLALARSARVTPTPAHR